MSEIAKTGTLVLVALATAGAAWFGRPQYTEVAPAELQGQALFADFTDPYAAKTMTVSEVSERGDAVSSFEVALQNGLWVIPSHGDYPADAEENLKKASTQLIGLEVVNAYEGDAQDFKLFGLNEPTDENLANKEEDEQLGKQVTFKDEQGNELASLVIGKEVQDREGLRYVRVPGQNAIYLVKINPDELSTDFADWIEADLLDLNAMDITQMTIRDYFVDEQMDLAGNVAIDPQQRLSATVSWNADDAKWELQELQELRGDSLQPVQLLDVEELNKPKLDAMKTALDDLKIIDVRRKPDGLKANLSANEALVKNAEEMQSLVAKGYFPVRTGPAQFDIYSSDGEIEVDSKDGVIYTLRFGREATVEQGDDDASKISRYVMVTASLNPDQFDKPVLELPEDSATEDPVPDAPVDTSNDAGEEAAAPADSAAEPAANVESPTDDNTEASDAGDAEEANPAAGDEPAASDEEAGEEETSEPAACQTDEDDADSADEAAEADDATGDDASNAEAARDAAIKEYQRKKEEYDEKLKKAEERVAELNARFAPWYYIMAEDDYKKIHLSRADILKVKEGAADEGFGVDALNDLEGGGLEKEK
ncbi:MAG: DUF4340 domain-containing protein [Planctomycetales bacterium]|nr:DUF4340 domain-containing protein [Planctomycetales bacterium]